LSNWVRLPNNSTTIKPGENNQIDETNKQPVILEQVTTKKTLKKILMDISKQVLETKYTLNLGQLLRMILDIKCYILNLIPSKPISLELVVAYVTIDYQMVVIQVQVGKKFIEGVLLNGVSRINIITKKLRV
jgi:hypothetical protein